MSRARSITLCLSLALLVTVAVVTIACSGGGANPGDCVITDKTGLPSCTYIPEIPQTGINPMNGKCEVTCHCSTWAPCSLDGGTDLGP